VILSATSNGGLFFYSAGVSSAGVSAGVSSTGIGVSSGVIIPLF
jgi:hypothetical protein